MATLAELVIKIVGDSSGFDKTASSTVSKAKKIGAGMSKVGKMATIGLTLPIIGAGVAAVSAASDFEESLTKVGVVFDKNSEQVIKWSETSASAFGISQQQALEAAGTYGNLFSAMGITAEATTDMSTNLVELAADLASFNNMNPEEVLLKLQSGLVGQAMPLRALGVNLSAAETELRAFEMGLADAEGELSVAALAQARYAIILEQTSLAQGDFQRTSEGMANQSRILKAELSDLTAGIGADLLPIALQLVGAVRSVIDWFMNLSPATKKVILVVLGLAAVIGPLLMILGPVVAGFGALLPILGAIISPVGLLILAIIALAVAIFVFKDDIIAGLTKVWEFIKETVGKLIAKFQEIWDKIKSIQWLQLGKDVIMGIVNGIKSGLGALASAIGDVASTIIGGIGDFLGIHSDSKVAFKAIGVPTGAGIVGGAIDEVRKTFGAGVGAAIGSAIPTIGGSAVADAGVGTPGGAQGSEADRKIEVNVYNPLAEQASETIPRELQKLAYLGVIQ